MGVECNMEKKEIYVDISEERRYVFIAPEFASDSNMWDATEALKAMDAKKDWVILPFGWQVIKL